MKAELWEQVDKFFQAAVELDAARRSAYLDLVCAGDQTLRSEVESLLTADSFEWNFIEEPALESAALLLANEKPRLTPGEQLDRYEVLELVGKGGMGEVYLARDRVLNRNIALKLLPFDHILDEGRLQRFRREAETVSALNHPNILTIHELGSVGDQQFIATEFVEGNTLRNRIKRGRLSVLDAVEIAIQTASALAAAHRAAIVHRDIKPENIMLRPDGYVKVLDFGLAKLVEEKEPAARAVGDERIDTSSMLLMGTPRYMSPEQVSGSPVDARSDIFSLGVVLYEMVTGRPPFDEKNPGKLTESILKDDPPDLDTCLDAVPNTLRRVVARMLSKDRNSRYGNADELLVDLKLLKKELDENGSPAAATTFRSTISLQRRSTLALVWVLVLALASAIGFASYTFLRSTSGGSPTDGPLKDKGKWTTKASISSPRWQAEPAVLNGVLYVVGGWNVCTPFADLESYDPESNTWTQHTPMLTARGAHGVAVLDEKLYAVGGSTDCGQTIASVEAYEPASNTWSAKAPLPNPRQNHMVAAAAGKLYAIGGISRASADLDLNTQYDPQSDKWKERAPMPTARIAAAVVVVHGIIYVIGGRDNRQPLATVEAYDPTTDSWTSKRSMLTPRDDLAVADVNGIIYAFGGTRSDQVEAYDPTNDTWTVVAQMPTRRAFVHAAALRGSIYVAGGFERNNYVSSVMAFTPEPVATFTAASCLTMVTAARVPMPTARSNMGVAEVGGMIYAVGGFDGNTNFLTMNEAYDPDADRWIVKAPMPVARETTASAVVDEKLYVIGGNAQGDCVNLNQVYDHKTDTWTTKASMPTPRCSLSAVALDGLIYALGGTNTSGSIKYSTVEIYDPASDTWTASPEMPTGRQYLAAVALNDNVYAVGGWNPALSPDFLDTVEAYDPTAKTWTTKASMPTPRSGLAAGVLNGLLVAVGGDKNDTTLATVEVYDPASDTWTALPNLPTARAFSSGVVTSNTLYMVGGTASLYVPGSLATNTAVSIVPCSK